ncbi:hypothetical protein [Arthrobacter sp. N1]|uniref:hypothetical protein n=1 Tax=Arthrobacter sp. N1 TaxID=619291 RepID=UPI003BB06557
MKTTHALGLTALLIMTLTSCSSGATESAPSASAASSSAPATATPPPSVPRYVAPTTLREALTAAMGPFDQRNALGAMEDLRRIAVSEVKPSISAEHWGEIELVRINASIDLLNERITERQMELESIRYATLIAGRATNAGVLSW